MSRKGDRDTDRFMEQLENHDCELWSQTEPMVQDSLGLARQMYSLMKSEMNREEMEQKPMARVNRSNAAAAAWSGPEAEAPARRARGAQQGSGEGGVTVGTLCDHTGL